MSESSASGGGTTPAYSTPSISRSYAPTGQPHGSSLSTADDTGRHGGQPHAMLPAPATAETATHFYASGHSRMVLSAEGSPLYHPVTAAGGYMYGTGERRSPLAASGSSLDSAGLEDSQKHSYHPIELMLGDSERVGSLESARLVRNLSLSMPSTGGNVALRPSSLSGQESVASTSEQALSPNFAQPVTHGLKPPTLPGGAALPSVSTNLVTASATSTTVAGRPGAAPAPAEHPGSLSDSLTSLPATLAPPSHQRLPEMHSRQSTPVSQLDASPSEPSMTVRGATPARLIAMSPEFARFPSQPQLSPNSSGRSQRPASPSQDSLLRQSRLPFMPVPRPPTAPDLQATPLSTSGSPVPERVATTAQKPGPAVAVALPFYETPLALVTSTSSTSTGPKPGVDSSGDASAEDVGAGSHHGSEAGVPSHSSRGEESGGGGGARDGAARDNSKEGSQPSPEDAAPPTTQTSPTIDATPPPAAQPPSLPARVLEGSSAYPKPPLVRKAVAPMPLPAPAGDAPQPQEQQQQQQKPTPPPPPPLPSLPVPMGVTAPPASSPSSSSADSTPSRHSPPPPPTHISEPVVGANFLHFSPLIQQFDFRKADIKGIACTGAFTMGDVNTVPVKLRLLRHEVLARTEPIANIQQAAMAAGRVKAPKVHHSSTRSSKAARGAAAPETVVAAAPAPAPPAPRTVDVSDFNDTIVVFDNALLAVSFALWGSVALYNDLVVALRGFCLPDGDNPPGDNDGGHDADEDQKKSACNSDGEGGVVRKAAPPPPQPAAATATRRVRVPFSSVLRFLNHCGVDVLVTTPNRKAASSFCSKRSYVQQRCSPSPATVSTAEVASSTPGPPPTLRRVLVALSYDRKNGVWCPLTTARPIRHIAAWWHGYRRQQRRNARRDAHREMRRAEAEAAVEAQKAAVEAKLRAWQERTAIYRDAAPQPEVTTSKDAAAAAAAAAAVTTGQAAGAESEGGAEHVVVVVPSNSTSSEAPSLKSSSRLPFHGMAYPNLVQTDVGFVRLLWQGMHPLFSTTRLRLLVGVPLGLVSVLFGIAFIIYVSKTTDTCLADAQTGLCIDGVTIDSGESSRSASSISTANSNDVCLLGLILVELSTYHVSLTERFLYGAAVAPGTCLVVAICCGFAALVDGILIVYFAVRYLALGGVRPCFFHVLRGVQAVLSGIVCAFAAYTVFVFHRRQHLLSCSWFATSDATLCKSRLASCGHRYAYVAYGLQTGVNVPLMLAIVYLALCVLHGLVAALPVLPSVHAQNLIPTATPDAYAFRPSLFAPDGPTPAEVAQLRQAMQQPLRQELRQHVQARDRLLTTTTTIGEMMQANRAQSLRQMELNEERRQRRARPFQRRAGDDGSGLSSRGAAERRRYMVVGPDGEDGGGSRQRVRSEFSLSFISSSSSSSRSGTGGARRSVVLAPRLVQRVAEISSRVQELRVHSSNQNPFNSPSASLVEETGDASGGVSVFSPAPSRAGGITLQPLARAPSPGTRAVVVTEDDSFSSDNHTPEATLPRSRSALARTIGIALPTYAASTRPSSSLPPALQPTPSFAFASAGHPPASPRSPPAKRRSMTSTGPSRTPRRSTGGGAVALAGRWQSMRSNYFARRVSTRSAADAVVDTISPAVDAEIDQIVTRLRVQHSAAADEGATAAQERKP